MDNSERQTAMGTRHRTKTPQKKQPKHSTQKSKKMINTDPIYQEWTIQRQTTMVTRHRTKTQKKTNQNTQHRKVKR
jgi:hypothetical protein